MLFKRKSGEITVFLALICIAVISFILVLIRSAKISFIRTRIEGSTDIALISSFSEYNKMLFEKYHLLFVDTTYKGVLDGGDESFREHFNQYFEINLYGDSKEPYGLLFASSDVNHTVYADDEEYKKVMDQIRYYVVEVLDDSTCYSDEEILDEYINTCISQYTDIELYDEIYELSCDEKREFIISVIEEEMKESYGYYFDFSKHLYSAQITTYVSTDSSKMYECKKSYSLN